MGQQYYWNLKKEQKFWIIGHETYYPKFGYVPASQYQIKAPFEVPDKNFMIKELTDGGLEGKSGVIHYSEAFN